MKYVDIDTEGSLAFYDSDINSIIPPSAIILSQKEYIKFFENQAKGIKQTINFETGLVSVLEKTIEDVKEELRRIVTEKKKSVAYGGLKVSVNNQTFIFSTSLEEQATILSNIKAFELNAMSEITWKCLNSEGNVIFVKLSKAEFIDLFSKSMAFVNSQSVLEESFMKELEDKTDFTESYLRDFKDRVEKWNNR